MSNVKVLSRVVIARRRLRDLSAGEVAIADAARMEADQQRQACSEMHDSLLELDDARIATIDSVRGLEILQEERQEARIALKAAYVEVARRSAHVEERRAQLYGRERDLRSTERQLGDARKLRDEHVAKFEQAISDELSGAAVHRSRS